MSVVDRFNRRQFAVAAPVAVVATLAHPTGLFAQADASPAAGGMSPVEQAGAALVSRVLALDPAELLERVQTDPVETALFPANAGSVTPFPWEDDADLQGAIGAAQFGVLQAAILVFPDERAAINALDAARAESPGGAIDSPLLGLPGATLLSMFGPLTIVVVGNVQVWGWGVPPGGEIPASPQDALLPLSLRSLANAVATLDHLRLTLSAGS